MSITIKSVGMYSWSILKGTFSSIPTSYFIYWLNNFKDIYLGFSLPIQSLLQRDRVIRLTLTPRWHRYLSMTWLPITQGIEKLFGYFSLGAILFFIIALDSLVSAIIPWSLIFLLFARISFKNFAYEGIWAMASVKGMLIWSFFKILTNFLNCSLIPT